MKQEANVLVSVQTLSLVMYTIMTKRTTPAHCDDLADVESIQTDDYTWAQAASDTSFCASISCTDGESF
jgi:hypothetical protein